MMHDTTIRLLSVLQVNETKPLLICDVDEVVVHFTKDLEIFLSKQSFMLDTSTYALNGNIRSIAGNTPVSDAEASRLINDFFRLRTKYMQPIDGAIAALKSLSRSANVVMLTNLPHEQGEDRSENLKSFGLDFPVITNSGPKGPAIFELANRVKGPVVFVDDSPGFIASAYTHAPDVHLVHFVQDQRYEHLIEKFPYTSLRTHSWDVALPHIESIFR